MKDGGHPKKVELKFFTRISFFLKKRGKNILVIITFTTILGVIGVISYKIFFPGHLSQNAGLPSGGHSAFVTLIDSVSSDKSPPSKRKFVRSGLILFTGITLLYFFPVSVPYATLYKIKCAGWQLFYRVAYRTIWAKYNLAPIHIIERLPGGVALIYTIWPTPDDGPGGIRALDVTELTPIYVPMS